MLIVHRSERADALAAGLADVLRDPPEDPFAPEVVAVPAKGVERWLAQRLSHVLGACSDEAGVCANVRFPSPSDLTTEVVAAASGVADDPWRPERMTWSLLEVIDACLGEPWCATLAGHLGTPDADDDHRRGRRFSTAQHLARRFDSYGSHRPGMLRDWAVGDDTDGVGGRLDDDLAWQSELWRRLRERIGRPSPAERLAHVRQQLAAAPDVVDLPARLSVFGPTRLAALQLTVLSALAERRELHLWVPHPSPALWDELLPHASSGPRRRTDTSAIEVRNPLLASLGRDARELQVQLGRAQSVHHPPPPRPQSLLGRLQVAIADDVPPAPRPLAPDDRSLQVHACHGPARQVEVLREVLVGLLADDPTLEPRDVLVMCPDIERYAPLISGTFGLATDGDADEHPGLRLRVRLADRSLRQTNPLLRVLSALLDLADARVTASQVLDLASAPPVRRRFRFDDDDLERLQRWVAESGVRWGLDAGHRARFRMSAIPQNTWRAGLDRLLLGVAVADEGARWLGLALPLDDVDSSDVDLVGRLAEYVDRVRGVLDAMAGERPLAAWLDTLSGALDALTDVREADAWQSAQAHRELAQVADEAGDRADDVRLSLADVRALLADRLHGRPTRANFRTGTLTMCTLVPMRSVPHRVICLLGLDDGRFPRTTTIDGDDVLARQPCVGERDPRSEDRQLLLDAILAAGEHVVILYSGADPRTNQPRPPAVPVGEILDAVDAATVPSNGCTGRDRVLVRQPLQPFDPRNFIAGRLGRDGPFSFDRHALDGARRAALPRGPVEPFLAGPLDPLDEPEIALDDLIRFLEHPVLGFVRQRLDLSLPREIGELSDAMSVSLEPLQLWAIGERLLHARLDGVAGAAAPQAEWRRGTLPPGELGSRLLADLGRAVEPLVAASADLRTSEADSIDIDLALDDGTRMTGTVAGVHGHAIARVTYARLGPKQRLRAWVQVLALTAARPDTAWRAVTVGRGRPAPVATSVLGPVDPEVARTVLATLVELRRCGLCEPLPAPARTSAAYAAARRSGMSVDNALAKAEREWQSTDRVPGEQAEDAHALVWGADAEFAVLLADRRGTEDDPTRFGALARAIWEPLLAAERRDEP